MRIAKFILIIFSMICFSKDAIAKTIRINNNKPIQEQFILKGATYVIKNNIDLKGDTLSVPSRSRIKFTRKGLLTNGTLIGNNTLIAGHPKFDGLRLKGTFDNKKFYTSWCLYNAISDFIEDVMNLSNETIVIVDCNITMSDRRSYVSHLSLKGKKKNVTNSDRFYITYGGTEISNLSFMWDKPEVIDPADNYSAVVVYHNLLEKDTTVVVKIENVDADGGHFCSYFMRQYKSSITPGLRTNNMIENCCFSNFTRGAIWTCGGTGKVVSCEFHDIGYDKSQTLRGVTALRLGYSFGTYNSIATGYFVEDCKFQNIVAAYNPDNDGRELHGILAYGDSLVVRKNSFHTLSTSFTKETDTGMDSEMLYIKGSYNVIEDNILENGAGSASNGVITLKVGSSKANVIRGNRFMIMPHNGKCIYLSGADHVIDGNVFSYSFRDKDTLTRNNYVIYLGHRENLDSGESASIINNTFSLPREYNYMAIYANYWGELSIINNEFHNISKLLKCNNRGGKIIISDNVVTLDGLFKEKDDYLIEVKNGKGIPVNINNNTFSISNSTIGGFVKGSDYDFSQNKVSLIRSSVYNLLQGTITQAAIKTNHISFDESTRIEKALVEE